MTARSSSRREVAANRGHACHGTTTTFPTPTTGTPAQLVAVLDAGERTGPPRGQEIARVGHVDRGGQVKMRSAQRSAPPPRASQCRQSAEVTSTNGTYITISPSRPTSGLI